MISQSAGYSFIVTILDHKASARLVLETPLLRHVKGPALASCCIFLSSLTSDQVLEIRTEYTQSPVARLCTCVLMHII